MAATDTTDLKKGTKVVANADLPGVPEGTTGKVGDAVGLTLIRYRVDFDNGTQLTSVTHTKLVPEKEWETYKADREAAATAAAEAAAAPPAEAAPEAEAPAAEGGASAKDERLAAMLAKSKAARERKAAGD